MAFQILFFAPSVITCPATTAFVVIIYIFHYRKMETKPRVEGLDVTGFQVQTP